MNFENVVVVTNKTRLEQLIERFNTKAQARFYIEHSGGDFGIYEEEHSTFYRALEKVNGVVSSKAKLKSVDRKFLPNYLFNEKDIVVALGQDGLVANVAKYVNGLPLIGINPDPKRNDGILLPFTKDNFELGLIQVLENKFRCKKVTMAQASTSDGQTILGFNDLFIGPSSHTSARYKINYRNSSEEQSSSGLLVSTGAGSTGWLSSVVNMTNGFYSTFQPTEGSVHFDIDWEDDRLIFVVREPFLSKHSQVGIAAGIVTNDLPLSIESHMPFNGVIFSDGIESDFIQFNAGCKVQVTLANKKANIVQL
jgi:NAD kinase